MLPMPSPLSPFEGRTFTLCCEDCEATDVSNVCNAVTSCVGTLASPGALRLAENEAFATAS